MINQKGKNMGLTVGQISPQVYRQMPVFKGENVTENIKPQKNGESKLGATLACLATLGAGAVATVYAFKKGKLTGKLAGLAEGKAAGIKIGEANAAKAAEKAAKPLVKPIAEKLHIADCTIRSIEPVTFKLPDGTEVSAFKIREKWHLQKGKMSCGQEMVDKIVDKKGNVLSIKSVSNSDFAVRKARVIENGQKVTKKYIYRDGKLASVESSTYNAKTGVVKTVAEHSSGGITITQKTKDKFGHELTIYKDKDGNIGRCDLRYIDDVGRYAYDLKEAKEIIKRLNIPFEI